MSRLAALFFVSLGLGCAAGADPARVGVLVEPGRGRTMTAELALDGTRLAYDVHGAGAPVVLLQGGQLGRELWDDVVRDLERDHLVVVPDLRGYGASPIDDTPYAHHEDVRALLDHLGLERVHVVGLSLGGRVAVDLALTAPGRVASLVLSGPGLSGWEFDGESFSPIAAAIEAGDSRRAAELWLEHPYMAPSMEDLRVAPRVRELALANHHVWGRTDEERALEPPAVDRLRELGTPTVLLVGSRDVDDIHGIARLLERRAPDLERRDVVGGGHLLPLERPAWFAATVREWTLRHPVAEEASP